MKYGPIHGEVLSKIIGSECELYRRSGENRIVFQPARCHGAEADDCHNYRYSVHLYKLRKRIMHQPFSASHVLMDRLLAMCIERTLVFYDLTKHSHEANETSPLRNAVSENLRSEIMTRLGKTRNAAIIVGEFHKDADMGKMADHLIKEKKMVDHDLVKKVRKSMDYYKVTERPDGINLIGELHKQFGMKSRFKFLRQLSMGETMMLFLATEESLKLLARFGLKMIFIDGMHGMDDGENNQVVIIAVRVGLMAFPCAMCVCYRYQLLFSFKFHEIFMKFS